MSPLEIIVRGHLTAQGIARTWQIALRLGLKTDETRRKLLKLERDGVIRRHPRYSAPNDICWTLNDQHQGGGRG